MFERAGNFIGAVGRLAGVVILGVLVVFAGLMVYNAAMPSGERVRPPMIEGDDNRDGTVNEGESGWDCATMGNKTCDTAAV